MVGNKRAIKKSDMSSLFFVASMLLRARLFTTRKAFVGGLYILLDIRQTALDTRMAARRVFPGLDSTIFRHILCWLSFSTGPHILEFLFCIAKNTLFFSSRTVWLNPSR